MVQLDNFIIEKCRSNRNLLKQYFSDDINSFGEKMNMFHEAYIFIRIQMIVHEFNDLTLDEFKYMLSFSHKLIIWKIYMKLLVMFLPI